MVNQGEVFDLVNDKTLEAVVKNGKLWDIREFPRIARGLKYVPPVATTPP